MKKLFKILIFAAVFVVLTVQGALYLTFSNSFEINGFGKDVFVNFEKETGLKISAENLVLKPVVRPSLDIDVKNLKVKTPDDESLLTSPSGMLKVKAFPLLIGKIEVERLELNWPAAVFSVDDKGIPSFEKYINKIKPNGNFSKKLPELILLNDYRSKIIVNSKPFYVAGDLISLEKQKFSDEVCMNAKGRVSSNDKTSLNYDFALKIPEKMYKKPTFNPGFYEQLAKFEPRADIFVRLVAEKSGRGQNRLAGNAVVNNIVFTLNDKEIKRNFLYLTFDDDIVSLNADLKTSPSDKTLIKGSFKTGKDRQLSLNVKSQKTDLKVLKDISYAFLSGFDVLDGLKDFDITGKGNFDFSVNTDFKTVKSEGRAFIRDASVKNRNFPSVITGINSFVNFNNNSIIIEPTKFKSGKFPAVLSGKIDSSANTKIVLKGEKQSLSELSKIFLPTDITSVYSFAGETDFETVFSGKLNDLKSKFELSVKNFAVSSKTGKILNSKFVKVLSKGDFSKPEGTCDFSGLTVYLNNTPFSSEKMRADITSQGIKIPQTSLSDENSVLNVKAQISNYIKSPTVSADFSGKISSAHVKRILKKACENASTKGFIDVSGSVRGSAGNFAVKLKALSDKNNYVSIVKAKETGAASTAVNADLRISGDGVKINNLLWSKTSGIGSDLLKMSGVVTPSGGFKNLSVQILSPITFVLPDFPQSSITVKGGFKSPNGVGISESDLTINSVLIPEYGFSAYGGSAVAHGGKLKLVLPDAKLLDSGFSVQGTINGLNTGKMTFENPVFSVNNLSSDFTAIVAAAVKPDFAVKNAVLTAKKLSYADFSAENFKSSLNVTNGVIGLKNFSANAYGGTVSGAFELNSKTGGIKLNVTGSGANAGALLSDISGKDEPVSGKTDFSINVSTYGNTAYQQRKNAVGKFSFTSKNGEFGNLGRFENFLYAKNFISQNSFKTSLFSVTKTIKSENTDLFTVAKGSGTVENNNAFVSATMKGPNQALFVKGRINLLTGNSDVDVYGRISKLVENMSGKFANPVPPTIMTSYSSVDNLFFDDFYCAVPYGDLSKIPDIKGQSRIFAVKISGNVNNVKSVKSFKWHTLKTDYEAPLPFGHD